MASDLSDKRTWDERRGIEVDWPLADKPGELLLDNAAEFKSEALRRGWKEYGVALDYRAFWRCTAAGSSSGSSAR